MRYPGEQDQVLDVWLPPDRQYSFLEFASREAADRGLALSDSLVLGYKIKLSRAEGYLRYHEMIVQFVRDENIGHLNYLVMERVRAADHPPEDRGVPSIEARLLCPPTRVLCLKNVLTVPEVLIDE
jgi:hypothetical protein